VPLTLCFMIATPATPVVMAGDPPKPKATATPSDDIPTLKPVKDAPGTDQAVTLGGVVLYILEVGLAIAVAVGIGTMAWQFLFSEKGGGMGKSLGLTGLALVGLGILADLHGFTAGWTSILNF
jgi:hypothetical protein